MKAPRALPPRVHLRALTRLEQIHEFISTGKFPSVQQLAALTERSPRTVKRDLAFMRHELRAPLKHDRKCGGWCYTEPGWTLPPVRLSEGELLAFFTAEQALKTAGQMPEATLIRAALTKLAKFLPEEVSFNLTEMRGHLNFQTPPHVEIAPQTLHTLAQAAREQRVVEFDYYSPHNNAHTHRRAGILLLHHFAGDWYAISYDQEKRDTRDFLAGRMTKLRLTPDYFAPPPGWNARDYLQRGFSMMRGGKLVDVALVFDSYQARWIRERGEFHPHEKRVELRDGSLRLSFQVGENGLDAVARFCLAYAGHCRAEQPAALRDIMRKRLTQSLQQHQE